MANRILLSLVSEQSEFQVLQAADGRRAADAAGLDLEVIYADGNAIQQIHQAFEHIHAPEDRRPSAILMEAISDSGLQRLARNAARAGIAWVSLNRRSEWLPDLRREFPGVPISSVTSDQVEMGRIQGRQTLALLPHGGNVLCIQGPQAMTAASDRLSGFQEIISSAPIRLSSVDGLWTEVSGEQAMRSFLRLQTHAGMVDLVVCQNDEMAVGARRALHQHAQAQQRPEWKDVPFIGVDGLPRGGQRLVDAGELAATVVNSSNSGPAIKLLNRYFRDGEHPPEEVVLKPEPYPADSERQGRPMGSGRR